MARTKHKSSHKLAVYRRSPKPVVIRTTKLVKPKRRHHSSGGGFGRGLMDKKRLGIVIGGAAVGFLQKQNMKLPELPILGQAGTIGLAAYFLSNNGKNKLADEICTAALTIAAYEYGSTGKVVGEDSSSSDPFAQGFVTGV
jgi:hypothetical protein